MDIYIWFFIIPLIIYFVCVVATEIKDEDFVLKGTIIEIKNYSVTVKADVTNKKYKVQTPSPFTPKYKLNTKCKVIKRRGNYYVFSISGQSNG